MGWFHLSATTLLGPGSPNLSAPTRRSHLGVVVHAPDDEELLATVLVRCLAIGVLRQTTLSLSLSLSFSLSLSLSLSLTDSVTYQRKFTRINARRKEHDWQLLQRLQQRQKDVHGDSN